MKFSFQQTILLILLVNITAAIGAFAFGYVQDWLGHKGALALTLLVWIAMTIVASLATTSALFWLAANLAGLAMGSSQSAGRAMTGVFAPATRLAEFYGLWTLSVQVAAILGPLTFGAVLYLTDNNYRLGMLITGGFFIIGLLVIASIDIERGRRAAAARRRECYRQRFRLCNLSVFARFDARYADGADDVAVDDDRHTAFEHAVKRCG